MDQFGAQATSKTPRISRQLHIAENLVSQGVPDHGGIAQLGEQATSKTPRTPRQLHIAENLVSQGIPDHGGIAQLGGHNIQSTTPSSDRILQNIQIRKLLKLF